MTTQATAYPLYRTLDLRNGRTVERINGKPHYVFTDNDGRAVIGFRAHRRGNKKQAAATQRRYDTLPLLPVPQKPPGRFRRALAAINDLHAHEVAQAWAKTMLLWAIALGSTALIAKAVIWTWSA